jgi:putative DNA methylase
VKKKLIEVALPLDAINKASAREKSIRHGHPSTLHLWWARRPLAAARAVIFAQMVDDPSAHPDLFPTEKAQEKERQRLFKIIEELVKWENTTNEKVLQQARDEIWHSWRYTCAENADHPRAKELFDRHKLPAFHDPFAGGGSIPLEAQRLGLESYASDLNPVAVLINKAMIEIPPKFAGRLPVNPETRKNDALFKKTWHGAQGLAEDVRYYGRWMRDEAEKRIGHLYPKVEVTAEMAEERPDLKKYVGRKLTVIAWLWARTVKSPNPAFTDVDVPLASTFILSSKKSREVFIEPLIQRDGYRFAVRVGKPMDSAANGTKSSGANFRCLMSHASIPSHYIRAEGKAGRIGSRMMAIIAEGHRERVYLPPTEPMEVIASQAKPEWKPDVEFFQHALGFRVGNYGMTAWSDLFTRRQLVMLTTLSDLIREARELVRQDARCVDWPADEMHLADGGIGSAAYADAVAVYLAFAVSKVANIGSSIASWMNDRAAFRETFARQAIQVIWDFAEANALSEGGGSFWAAVRKGALVISSLPMSPRGFALQADAAAQAVSGGKIVSTDPPYYDNIGYADLSDFFYVWLRSSLRPIFPALFGTLAVPKSGELVATPHRHGGRRKAEVFFLDGMTQALRGIASQVHPAFPVTIFYAFRQAESKRGGGPWSTGWETFLEALLQAGFGISGTWPMRTEGSGRIRAIGSNALASSIVLVCRTRASNILMASYREFSDALRAELPVAVAGLQRGNIAPVDLAQAALGPGMAIYTRYAKVLDSKGDSLSVRQVLALINQILDEILAEQEGDFDVDSRWALAWFEQFGFTDGEYGIAETLSKAKNTSIQGLKDAGILDKRSPGGRVRLLRPKELPADWDPTTDARLTAWEMVHHLIRVLEAGGESAAAGLAAKLGAKAEVARELCYRLYTLCERKKRAQEALAYNGLVQSWPEIMRLARESGRPPVEQQPALFGEE